MARIRSNDLFDPTTHFDQTQFQPIHEKPKMNKLSAKLFGQAQSTYQVT